MTNIWTDTYKEIRKPFFEIEDPYTLSEEKKEKKEKEEKGEKEDDDKNENGKSKRWWDDDGDGKGWEKGEVSGSFKGKKKGVKEERELHSKKDKTEKLDVRDGIKNKIEINPSIEEQVKLWIDELVTEGYDLSEFTFDEMVEIYESADAEQLDEADTSAMPAKGDAVTTKVDPTESARRRAAQAQVRKERADVQLSMARATAKQGPHESVVSYLMNNNYIAEGVYDPKKSKLRPASERTAKQVTDKDRAEAKKEAKRTAEIHSKGETVLAGLRSSGKKGKVSTKPEEKPEAPEANRRLPSNRRNDTLAKKADDVLKKLKK